MSISCPPDSELRRLLEDDLSVSLRRMVAGHVEDCGDCQARLEEFSLAEELLQNKNEPVCQTPSPLEVLVEQLKQRAPTEGGIPAPPALEIHFPGRPTARGPLGQLGPYHVIERIASGGTGVLFRAYDEKLGRIVALKVLRRELAALDDALIRFGREARSVATLQHEHVVTIHDVVNPPDFPPYLVLEYIAGESLALRLRRTGACTPHEAAEWVRQVAEGLAAVHAQGVIHRDLKPSNIMLEARTQQAKLTDFGLALEAEQLSQLTQEGTLAGTPAYMSPEQIQDPKHLDPRTDVYSLGVVLYECLTGEVPFRGQMRMVLWQTLNDEPRPPRRLNDRIPLDLETICLKALAKDPQRRYVSALAFAEDLLRWEQGEPVLARPITNAARYWRWCSRNKGLAVLTVSVLWLLLTGTVGASLAALSLASANTNLRTAQLIAKTQAQVAADQRDLTLDTLQHMIFEVQDRPAATIAEEEAQARLLQIAREGVHRVAGALTHAQVQDFSVAQAHQRIGELLYQLEDFAAAEDHLEQAETILRRWINSADWGPAAQQEMALLEWQRGRLRWQRQGAQTARPFYADALQLAETTSVPGALTDDYEPRFLQQLEPWTNDLLEQHDAELLTRTFVLADLTLPHLQPPPRPAWTRLQAILQQQRGIWEWQHTREGIQERMVFDGLSTLQELRESRPEDPARWLDVVHGTLRCADLAWLQRDEEQLARFAKQALSDLQLLSLQQPASLRFAVATAQGELRLAQAAQLRAEWKLAQTLLQAAEKRLAQLVPRSSTNTSVLQLVIQVQVDLCLVTRNIGTELECQNTVQRAEQIWREVSEHPRMRSAPERQAWLKSQFQQLRKTESKSYTQTGSH